MYTHSLLPREASSSQPARPLSHPENFPNAKQKRPQKRTTQVPYTPHTVPHQSPPICYKSLQFGHPVAPILFPSSPFPMHMESPRRRKKKEEDNARFEPKRRERENGPR